MEQWPAGPYLIESRADGTLLGGTGDTRHRASWHVLEKCGFTREGTLQRHSEFPNLAERGPSDVFCYARVIGAVSGTGPRSSRDL